MKPRRSPSPGRRIAAFGIDYLVVAAYGAALFGASVAVRGGIPSPAQGPARAQLIGFFSMTLPVVLYFALSETSAWRGTFGKRMLGLRVVTLAAERAGFKRTLLRALIKFLPWEIAHTFIHQIVARSRLVTDEAATGGYSVWVLLLISCGGALWYVAALFIGDGRPPYDRIAGTQVV